MDYGSKEKDFILLLSWESFHLFFGANNFCFTRKIPLGTSEFQAYTLEKFVKLTRSPHLFFSKWSLKEMAWICNDWHVSTPAKQCINWPKVVLTWRGIEKVEPVVGIKCVQCELIPTWKYLWFFGMYVQHMCLVLSSLLIIHACRFESIRDCINRFQFVPAIVAMAPWELAGCWHLMLSPSNLHLDVVATAIFVWYPPRPLKKHASVLYLVSACL